MTRFDRTLPAALTAAVTLALAAPLTAQAHAHHAMEPAPDSAAVAETVEAYHRALQTGDTATAMSLLAPDVRILESGGMETRDEYRSHHLPGDMAFAAAVPRERGPLAITVVGDVAWAVSSSKTRGTYREREINAVGAELMVLTRSEDGWKIRAIHWSSRQAR